MAGKNKNEVRTKLSKEFQIKLRREAVPGDQAARDRLLELLRSIAASGRYDFEIVSEGSAAKPRRGERYDTQPDVGLFRGHGISLASEKTGIGSDAETKLKCKLHSLVPELLYRKPKKSWGWPAAPASGVKSRFKLEQDVHFNNTKYCATGYMTLSGHDHELMRVKDFLGYFPRLGKLDGVDKGGLLLRVKDWDEVVFDDMKFRIGELEVQGALVSRYERQGGRWDETEFSFKLKRAVKREGGKTGGKKSRKGGQPGDFLRPAAGWHYRDLQALSDLYGELFGISSVFIQSPSIFYFTDPVASRDVVAS